jgi:hypothetical protein
MFCGVARVFRVGLDVGRREKFGFSIALSMTTSVKTYVNNRNPLLGFIRDV